MITTIIRNFLSNAVKFSNPGGKIYLNVRNTAAEQVISVEDEGIGMSVEDVQKLFRIDVKNKTIGSSPDKGTGLGLILCREFTEYQKGAIKVKSKPGKGSVLPLGVPYRKKCIINIQKLHINYTL
ncbi:MAG TPA: ATP-binding protein [Bacteroidales bacterium]|nr:ATP-binding protein [Bacteroidales bacterium]